MAVIRTRKKEEPFVNLRKIFIEDSRLSWRARGLLVYLLSKPDDWQVWVKDLIKRAPDGRDAVYSILKELSQAGYITIEKKRNQSGNGQFIAQEYIITDEPNLQPADTIHDIHYDANDSKTIHQPPFTVVPDLRCPDTAFPDLGKPNTEKPDALINSDLNKNKLNKTITAAAIPDVKLFYSHPDENLKIAPEKNVGFVASNPAQKTFAVAADNFVLQADSSTLGQTQVSDLISSTPTPADLTIQSSLSPWQARHLEGVAAQHLHFLKRYTQSRLVGELKHTLLNPACFTQAKQDYMKKLNTMLKVIKEGRWTPPVVSTESVAGTVAVDTQRQAEKAWKLKLQEAAAECEHWKKIMEQYQQRTTPFNQSQLANVQLIYEKSLNYLNQLQRDYQLNTNEESPC